MMIASPLTKPSITGCGIIRTSLPSRSSPNASINNALSTTVAAKYAAPCCTTKATITTAIDPAAPEIIAGRPPHNAVKAQMIAAPYSPINGFSRATSAKARDSGTRANEAVKPANRSRRTAVKDMAYRSSMPKTWQIASQRYGTKAMGCKPGRLGTALHRFTAPTPPRPPIIPAIIATSDSVSVSVGATFEPRNLPNLKFSNHVPLG
ncbi:hypothetical protein RF55_18749 [Lasius niger]|uniref:Uncharacterized protein n=1 Tax=Lasius niger TaxID=67767 RepID=A0A0J7K0V1_LASNI|nr:hypothetical protein RF55_18749 [Lasius niger]